MANNVDFLGLLSDASSDNLFAGYSKQLDADNESILYDPNIFRVERRVKFDGLTRMLPNLLYEQLSVDSNVHKTQKSTVPHRRSFANLRGHIYRISGLELWDDTDLLTSKTLMTGLDAGQKNQLLADLRISTGLEESGAAYFDISCSVYDSKLVEAIHDEFFPKARQVAKDLDAYILSLDIDDCYSVKR
ncbi:hypothetical protein HOA92_01450 [archaeon]|nr:hypothetical protein [archaeon]MBT6761680.1 hypothetical protein [archaeon]